MLKILLALSLLTLSVDAEQWWRWWRPKPTPVLSVYWVDDNGAAAWAACKSTAAISGTAACTLATANANAVAGDVVYLRSGTYNTPIKPVNSGTLASRITYDSYNGETARLTDVGAIQPGIELDGVDYIRIFRLTIDTVYQMVYIHDGSSFNEIAYNTIHTSTGPANGGVNIFTISAVDATANVHNWVHHNTMYRGGSVSDTPEMGAGCGDAGGLLNIGADGTDDGVSNYNTIEDNVMYAGAHHALKTNSRYNVVRNNFVHNEAAYFVASAACQLAVDGAGNLCAPDGFYGNRAITILNNHTTVAEWFSDTFNLIESNRIGPGGLASDGNGADSLTLGGERDIARFNTIFGAQELGILFRSSGDIADNNRAYNNTVYSNGLGPACRLPPANPGFWIGGVRMPSGADNNVLLNNLLWDNPTASGREIHNVGSGNTTTPNWVQANGDPLFVNGSLADYTSPTIPDLSLQAGSGAIDAGTSLTLANGSGSSSVTLVVDDALYFQYGERGSDLVRLNGTMHADEIAIGTVSNTVKILSINYATNTLTLVSAMTWSDNAPIWLYKDSRGTRVLYGTAPDYGAHERQP